MIEFRNVCKSFADHRVIDGISFTVGTGEFFVLVGPSGGGKTTTLKMINRLVEPDSGQILIDGHDIASEDVRELRLGIGYVLQQIALFPNMTVGQNVTLIPELKHWPAAKRMARARELLGEVDLDPREYMNRMPSELSGGEQQRVGIIRALAAQPKVMLMDEPFSALDPITRTQLQELIKRLQRQLGITIVFVTHDIDEALYLADRIAVVHDGRIAQLDSPDAIRQSPADDFVADFFASPRERRDR
ncbi:sugar ABC transporter ATP-binding protein [Bifidobacterium animalis subsp. animalis MCC 0483]|uniref:ABC-type quaternary amine transporter n=1 Tax=Bifidobacterium animalis subsp. animalis MCC 0483 TaxID=1365955 RepID=A0AB34TA77_9BIFI|nr:ABC transporter ATP-binding protein [Bifidobacterium animalis]KOA50940.1 sugar ABC transporter ATP-binding protein [Bifidobacterium animalis subsp. animalis MCC 0483]